MVFDTTNFFGPVLHQIESFGPRIPNAILTFLLGYIVVRLLQYLFVLGLRAARVNRAMQQVIEPAIAVILWVGLAALVLQALGLNQIAIALSSSLAIIGVGLAAGGQKLVADVVAGLFLAKNRDFKIGQRIKIGDIEGRIHSLDSRKVRLLGDKEELFLIPNARFDEQIWHIVPNKEENAKHGKA